MSISIHDLDINFQLSILATMMENTSYLVAIRELTSGKLLYINREGCSLMGADDLPTLELLFDENDLGTGNNMAAPNPTHGTWHNINNLSFSGTYEESIFTYQQNEYRIFRLFPIQSDQILQRQLNKEFQRFEALFNYASIGILVTNQDGIITMVNNFALEQFGYNREELLGQQVEILIPQRVHHKHVDHRHRYNHHPQSRPMGIGLDLFAVSKDGTEFPVEISLSHYSNEEGSFVIAYINNITERKKAEENIEKLNNELEEIVEERTLQLRKALTDLEQSKEELTIAFGKEKELGDMKSRFVSMASHEFRTPLSTILSSAFLIKHYSEEQDQPIRNKHLQRIVNAVSLLTDTLNDFLSVGKIEEGKIQVKYTTFEPEDFVAVIIQEMQGLVKEHQTITYQHTGNKTVTLDTSLLKHIIMNLFGNAIKFTKAGGNISLQTHATPDSFQFKITDNGIGMSQEDQHHLFERFFRGANVSNIQGTGLGLHIVQKYTEMLHGSIACESKLGEGTTFQIIFPLEK